MRLEGVLKMKERKEVKLSDIASALDVSVVSVSNALNNRKGVSEELRRKVKEKADELGYKLPDAKPKKENKFYSIGVMMAERYVVEFPSFYMDVYKHIAQVITKRGGYPLLDVVDKERESLKRITKFFLNMEVDGILFVGRMDAKFIREVRKQKKVPVVGIDFYDLAEDIDYVVTDNLHGMQEMTRLLLDAGLKDIVFLGSPHDSPADMDRYMGYCKAMKSLGGKERIIKTSVKYNRGYEFEMELPSALPEAFAVSREKMAYLLIEKLAARGIRVPEDVSVVGFGHSQQQWGEYELTTYESSEKHLAQAGIDTLMKMIQGRHADREKRYIRTVGGRVIVGNTVAKKGDKK